MRGLQQSRATRPSWPSLVDPVRPAVSVSSRFCEQHPQVGRRHLLGELSIDLERVRGLPNFVAGSLSRAVEGLLARQLTANLASVSDALTAFLREDTVA